MNLYNTVYTIIRALSFMSILGVLGIGFIFPVSVVQALVIYPIALVFLMLTFVASSEKLKSVKKLADVVHIPDNAICKSCGMRKAA